MLLLLLLLLPHDSVIFIMFFFERVWLVLMLSCSCLPRYYRDCISFPGRLTPAAAVRALLTRRGSVDLESFPLDGDDDDEDEEGEVFFGGGFLVFSFSLGLG
jgi:hypothetical protein